MTDWTSKQIKEQLARIVASPQFSDSPKLVWFLEYIVDQVQAGQSERIKQYTIAVEALGYAADFDQSANPAVRIMARRLRRTLKSYYSDSGKNDPILIRIPRGGYVPEFVDNPDQSRANTTYDRPPHYVSVPQALSEPSIAVFEFEQVGNAEYEPSIEVGLTAEIMVGLTRFEGLSVLGPLSHTTSQQLDLQQARDEYGALYVLRGWVRKVNARIRISIDLIQTNSGLSEWAQTFEYDLNKTALFDIEDEVTSRISGAIADGAGVIFRELHSDSYWKHIRFSDSTRAVLTYNHGWQSLTIPVWKKVKNALDQALDAQPDNALLLALQANAYYADGQLGFGLYTNPFSRMKEAAKRAVMLDPKLQIAQYNMVILQGMKGDRGVCAELARKVVAMNPNHARILAGCATQVSSVGDYELGLDLIKRARRLNPHYPGWYFFVEYLHEFRRQNYEQAWAFAQLIDVGETLWHPLLRAAVLGHLGRAHEARPHLDAMLRINPDFLERPRDEIRMLFVADAHVDMVWDGLRKAGIETAVDPQA